MGQTIIVINDPSIAFELMRDRSPIYSSRPHQIFSGDVYVYLTSAFLRAMYRKADTACRVGWKNATGFLPYNDLWKIHRKNVTKVASTNASVVMFDRVQEAESAHFLVNMLDSPENLFGMFIGL